MLTINKNGLEAEDTKLYNSTKKKDTAEYRGLTLVVKKEGKNSIPSDGRWCFLNETGFSPSRVYGEAKQTAIFDADGNCVNCVSAADLKKDYKEIVPAKEKAE